LLLCPKPCWAFENRALLLVGFAGAFRRSEVVRLRLEDLAFSDAGIIVTLRKSKTDQEAEGREVGLPWGQHSETCPVRALRRWLDIAAIEQGYVFRRIDRHTGKPLEDPVSGYWVARVVQAAVQAAGGDPALYAGHSLRSGLATAAAERGASEPRLWNRLGTKASSRYAATYGVPRFFRTMPRLWPGSERVVEHEGR
jgi:integrase